MGLNGKVFTFTEREQKAQQDASAVYNFIANQMTSLQSRHDIAQRAGYAFGTDRDYYKVLGYSRTLQFDDYAAKYERQDIARRIVDAPAEDTWREVPKLLDGASNETPFVVETTELLQQLNALEALENTDALTGIGHYGVMFLGMSGDEDLSIPVTRQVGLMLMYLRGYDEKSTEIIVTDEDTNSPRFGQPEMYKIDFSGSESGSLIHNVHWTRVIHVAERRRRSLTLGTPRLMAVFNLLDDLLKVIGGASEAFWKLAYKGLIVSSKDGYRLPSDTTDLDNQLVEWIHDIRRSMVLDGADVKEFGGESVDPSAMVDTLISLIAAETGIPKRMLLGSERGNLASTQDVANWAGRIRSRRNNFAEPVMLRPLIDRLIEWGIVSPPVSGTYEFVWEPLFELNELEQAEISERKAKALSLISAGAPHLYVTEIEARELIGLPGQREDESDLLIDIANDILGRNDVSNT